MVGGYPEGDKRRPRPMWILIWAQGASSRQVVLPALAGRSLSPKENIENVEVGRCFHWPGLMQDQAGRMGGSPQTVFRACSGIGGELRTFQGRYSKAGVPGGTKIRAGSCFPRV